MALVKIDFFSEVLGFGCQADVILPEKAQGVGQDGFHRGGESPVLWLLHGASDDQTGWQRRTSIERYVAPLGIAVVMPAVQLSFYTNMAYGKRYFDFVADELPAIMRGFFRFSGKREDNFVAGLSMGGYGAIKLALTKPANYASAASLSGVLDIVTFADHATNASGEVTMPGTRELLGTIFGDATAIKGTRHDLLALLGKAKAENASLPDLYACCGTEDPFYLENCAFRDAAQQAGVPLAFHEEPGTHEWGFWDRNIQKVLSWLPLRP